MNEIETPRLKLRPIKLTDLDELAALYADPEVMKYITGRPRTKEESQHSVRWIVEHWEKYGFGMWAILNKTDDEFIGRGGLGFLDNTPDIEVGYALRRAWWDKGVATEVTRASLKYGFEQLKLDRIVGVTNPANLASRRVLEKCGLEFEGMAHYYNQQVTYYTINQPAYYRIVN